MFKSICLALLVVASSASEHATDRQLYIRGNSGQDNFFQGCRGKGNANREMELEISVYNLAYRQPMSPFFVAVHNEDAPDVFRLGSPAIPELGTLAETGNATDLVNLFDTDENVAHVKAVEGPSDVLLRDGEKTVITVSVSCAYPYVSMASMAVNTNDCFVGINHVKLVPDMMLLVPGYDSGTEVNNEDCDFIPGPACANMGRKRFERTPGQGEGVIGIHRGVHGTWNGEASDLDPSLYDWRNPMIQIIVKESM